MAIGLHGGRNLGVENEDAAGVLQGVDFLRDAAMGKDVEIGDDVIVVGGGNVAIDVALTAKRKGAKNVTLICLEKREEMPAWEHEIEEALEGDITIVNSFGPKSFFIDKGNKVSGIEFKTCTAVFDDTAASIPNMTTTPASLTSATPLLCPSARAPTWRASRSRASPSHGPEAWKPIR
jgi:NADPH-dependent glutamate synthase beta subunit-like oxidoreductase